MQLFAETEMWLETLNHNVVVSVVFAFLGLLILAGGYKVIDWITPGNLKDELLGNRQTGKIPNLPLAVVVAALIIALGMITASAIH